MNENKIWRKGLNGMLIVYKDQHVEVKADTISPFGGNNILCQCGRGEPSRDGAGYWVWENVNKIDRVNLLISSALDKQEIVNKLTPIFESVNNLEEFMRKYEGVDLNI